MRFTNLKISHFNCFIPLNPQFNCIYLFILTKILSTDDTDSDRTSSTSISKASINTLDNLSDISDFCVVQPRDVIIRNQIISWMNSPTVNSNILTKIIENSNRLSPPLNWSTWINPMGVSRIPMRNRNRTENDMNYQRNISSSNTIWYDDDQDNKEQSNTSHVVLYKTRYLMLFLYSALIFYQVIQFNSF